MSDYDTDFYRWTQTQAAALRAKDFAAVPAIPYRRVVLELGPHRRVLQQELLHTGLRRRQKRAWERL
jgi:Domain of unknown function DUF29